MAAICHPDGMFSAIDLIVIGRMKKNSVFLTPFDEYKKRLKTKLNVIELEGHSQKEELKKLTTKIDNNAALLVLDEKGKSYPSITLAQKLDSFDQTKLQIIIGGADGLNEEVRKKADLILSFGQQTWPHMMVRVMVMEQLYRSQQILSNHPYHRE